WASAQAASILAGLFLVAAGVLVAAIWPTLRMRGAPETVDAAPSAPERATIRDDVHDAGAPYRAPLTV
ncbi:MAG: hypothetical protein LH650_05505, partial [Chloroflexi bacterium]|nr:hypothetical protein [Chloroflexota bacterium]